MIHERKLPALQIILRRKHNLLNPSQVNIMMKNVVDVVLGGLTYWAFGYGLSYGDSSYSNSFVALGTISGGTWFVSVSSTASSSMMKLFASRQSLAPAPASRFVHLTETKNEGSWTRKARTWGQSSSPSSSSCPSPPRPPPSCLGRWRKGAVALKAECCLAKAEIALSFRGLLNGFPTNQL